MAGLYRIVGWIGWIVSYRRLDCIVSDALDCIVSAGSGNTDFYALSGYWWYGTDGTDGLDGTLVGWRWDGQTLAGSGTGAPPLAPEQERHHWLLRGGGRWVAVSVDNCFGAARGSDYLCQSSTIIQIDCRQIGTST